MRWGGDLDGTSLEQALQEFRRYQRALVDVRAKIEESLTASADGASRPMDEARLEALFRRKDIQLRREGFED